MDPVLEDEEVELVGPWARGSKAVYICTQVRHITQRISFDRKTRPIQKTMVLVLQGYTSGPRLAMSASSV